MQNFTHNIPTRLYFGKGQIRHLAEALDQFGKRVLLAYGGGSIKRMGLYDQVMEILRDGGFAVTELSGIAPNPRLSSVAEGQRLCRENGVDVILAVGGGSTIDCAKAIAAAAFYEGDLWEMVQNAQGQYKTLPVVDILTLSATGSEFDIFGVISNPDTNEKLGGMYCHPAVSICDPTYTFSVPAYQTAAGSADIMSHTFENYFSREADSDLSEDICEGILRSVMAFIKPVLVKPNARANPGRFGLMPSVAHNW